MQPSDTSQFKSATSGADEAITPEIVSALRGLRYGSIVVTIHDSKVVQIEKNEKVRLQGRLVEKPDDPSPIPRELILFSLLLLVTGPARLEPEIDRTDFCQQSRLR